jgi:hypothetical protein
MQSPQISFPRSASSSDRSSFLDPIRRLYQGNLSLCRHFHEERLLISYIIAEPSFHLPFLYRWCRRPQCSLNSFPFFGKVIDKIICVLLQPFPSYYRCGVSSRSLKQ